MPGSTSHPSADDKASPRRWLERLLAPAETVGRATIAFIGEIGYAAALLVESFYWLLLGVRRNQPVRINMVFAEMMEVGVRAIPLCTLLMFVVGVMLAIQGLYTLKEFGAQSMIVAASGLAITREFSPLIVGILVAGRSGAALAARLGTMQISQEIDALRVIGISPVRYLVSPTLVAMLVMVPTLTILGDCIGLLGAGLFSLPELHIDLRAYSQQTLLVLTSGDMLQGIGKGAVFAVLITLVGATTGFSVKGGAEGVGRATTQAVVRSISAVIIADMLFSLWFNR